MLLKENIVGETVADTTVSSSRKALRRNSFKRLGAVFNVGRKKHEEPFVGPSSTTICGANEPVLKTRARKVQNRQKHGRMRNERKYHPTLFLHGTNPSGSQRESMCAVRGGVIAARLDCNGYPYYSQLGCGGHLGPDLTEKRFYVLYFIKIDP